MYIVCREEGNETSIGIIIQKKQNWGNDGLWGDFNDILAGIEKSGGKVRLEFFFSQFRSFVDNIEMRDLGFRGRRWT